MVQTWELATYCICFMLRNVIYMCPKKKGNTPRNATHIINYNFFRSQKCWRVPLSACVCCHLWGGLSGDDLPTASWFAALSDLQIGVVTEALLVGDSTSQWIRAVVAWHQPVISEDEREIELDKIIFPHSLPPPFSHKSLHTFHSSTVFFTSGFLQAPSILLFPN